MNEIITAEKQREGVLVNPYCRLSDAQVRLIDAVSHELLENPGLLCYNQEAAEVFKSAGAKVEDAGDMGKIPHTPGNCARIRIPFEIIDKALVSAPSRITLGARNPDNRLILDAYEPRVRFGSGAETNIWLEVRFDGTVPEFTRRDGSIERLCKAAHLCENLEHLDFFIRCVNIRDKEVTEENKDVNKLLASLSNITKHVQAGLTSLEALDDLICMGEIIAGGKEAFEKNPVLSFITCVIKSPLQIVDDTASKLIEISRRRVPVVISSSPMGGATGPFDEFGMVAQINAEILAGVALNQLVAPGAPVLYGSVPERTRLDNLNDMYGAPEFNHYNIDCAQMARFYGLPCYSTAGVGDTDVPGIQATVEKMLTLMAVPQSGAQYIHYAFGLLERTNVFCPEQAVMDDAHIGIVKRSLSPPDIARDGCNDVLTMVREVMETNHKTYIYHLPLPTREPVYIRYPLEDEERGALYAAHRRYHEIMSVPRDPLPKEIQEEIVSKVSGVLPQTLV
ncbi:MAG: trimethylamine methyltransferase family protein [Candidatus Bipolaricaulia bacterium]